MKTLYLTLAGVLLLVLIGLLYGLKKEAGTLGAFAKSLCQVDSDCKTGQKCFVDPQDARRNVCAEGNMKQCEFRDFTKLSSCNPNDPNSCKDCINQPPFGCVVVSFGKPQIVTAGTGYTSGTYRAALLNPTTNVYNIDLSMDVIITTTSNASVSTVLVTDPKEKFKKDDIFKILGGNNDATIRLTEQPKPYFWQKDGKRVVLPESNPGAGWCLPPVDESIRCNPFTSDSILIQKINDQGKISYAWGCYCKQPSFMQHENTPISNCSALVGCGGFDLYVPSSTSPTCTANSMCTVPNTKCCNDERCLKGAETFVSPSVGKCYSKWITGDTTNNPKNGTCDCPTNAYYSSTVIGDYVVKTCATDPCEPTGTYNPQTRMCECKAGNVSCGLMESSNVIVTDPRCATTNTLNRCVEDPCSPGGKMRNLVNGGCDCDRANGYREKIDVNVPGGKVCKQLCANNGPCGNRGTCRIEGDEEVCDCICPYAPQNEKDKLCTLYTEKSRLGERCKERTTISRPRWWDQQYVVTSYSPVADSCCLPYTCKYAPGTSRNPVCMP